METINEVQSFLGPSSEARLVHRNEGSQSREVDRPSALGWYRILRVHYQWPLFEAIRFALWLAR